MLRPEDQVEHIKTKRGGEKDVIALPTLPVSGIAHPRPRQADRAASTFGGQIDSRAFFANGGTHPGFRDV